MIESLRKNLYLILNQLFPNALAYINFVWLWIFVWLMITTAKAFADQPIYVIVSALGCLYCLNEWIKAK